MKKWRLASGEIVESENKPADDAVEVKDTENLESDQQNQNKGDNEDNTVSEKLKLFEKQMNNMQKQQDMQKTNYENKIKELEEELLLEKKKSMSEKELLELEAQEKAKQALEQESELLRQYEETKKRLEALETANKEKEFENRKLREKNKHPYISKKIEACETEEELNFLFKFTDINKEKALYEAENNPTGSVTTISGAKSVEEVKPLTLGQKLEARKQERLSKRK